MKAAFLLWLFLACSISVDAQTAFAPIGATWQFSGASVNYYYHARAVATTTVHGKSCSAVDFYWHRRDYPVGLYDTRVFCTSGDTVFIELVKDKLYPLYIFNVHAGDTVPFYGGVPTSSYPDSFFYVRIDSMKPMPWGSSMLRTVWGKTIIPQPYQPGWRGFRYQDSTSQILYVERLGAINGDGLLPWGPVLYFEEKGGVSCYYDGTLELRFSSSDSCNGIPAGLETVLAIAFSLYPNPVNNSCSVRFAQPLAQSAQIVVYDINGRNLATAPLQAGTTRWKLDMDKWVPGVYQLELSCGQEKVKRRVIKE